MFFGPSAVGAFLSPRGHRARQRRLGAAHAILAYTEVIRAVILSVRAVSLFFKPGMKSILWPRIHTFGIMCG